jgi:hypothetical protein
MTTISAGAVIATGYWDTQTGAPTSAPGNGKYRADNWAAPTLIAVNGTDANGYDRQAGMITALPGDVLWQRSPSDSQNYQEWAVVSVTDQGTWVQYAVSVTATGATFTAPGSNQRRLLELLQQAEAPPGGEALPFWQLWAPPLDPPTPGGLPFDTAQMLADATWGTDPHLCAALQWEAYAGMLPPAAAVAQVSTGAQSVSYSPPMPGGDSGLAMARAAWHRSLMSSGIGVELVQSPPALPSAPGTPWPSPYYDPSWNWWAVG